MADASRTVELILRATPHDVLAWASSYLATYGERLDHWLWAEPLQRAVWLDRAAANSLAPHDQAPPGKLEAMRHYLAYEQELRAKYLEAGNSKLDIGSAQA